MRLDQMTRLEDGSPKREGFPHTLTGTEDDCADVILDIVDIEDNVEDEEMLSPD